MMVDTTVYGWLLENEVVCAACTGVDYWDSKLAILLGEYGPKPLYSIDDIETRGLSCGIQTGEDCTGWVFPPCCDRCAILETELPEDEELVYDDYEDHYTCTKCSAEDDD